MKKKRSAISALLFAVIWIIIPSFVLFGCGQATEDPDKTNAESTSPTEATSENADTDESSESEATTLSETEGTVFDEDPELIMTDWHVEYFSEDEFSDLEAYTFIISIQSSRPIPEGLGLSMNLTLKNSDGDVLSGQAHYYGDIKFDGLQNFSLSFACHNYINDKALLDKLSGIEEIEAEFNLGKSSTSATADTPYAYVELSTGDLSFEIDGFGIRDPLLKFENMGYPAFGECVIFVKGSEEPVIIHVGEDFDDPAYLSGYTQTAVDLTKVERVFYCVNYDVALEIG